MTPNQNRLIAIDYTRAFAIILVVIGHWVAKPEPEWWHSLNKIIYVFHMPLFLAISGYLYMHTKKPVGYVKLLSGKFRRLLVPYFFTSLIIITLKLVSQGSAKVDNPVSIYSYIECLYYPAAGYFLWFMWALWWMFVIVPLFKTRTSRIALFVGCLILHGLNFSEPQIFCIAQTLNMSVFFVAGTLIYDWKQFLLPAYKMRYIICLSILFVAFEIAYMYGIEILKPLASFTSIILFPAIFKYCERFLYKNCHKQIMLVSSTSFIIYLFHTTFEGFIKSAAHSIIEKANGFEYGVIAFAAVTATTYLCVLLAVKVISKSKITRWMFALK